MQSFLLIVMMVLCVWSSAEDLTMDNTIPSDSIQEIEPVAQASPEPNPNVMESPSGQTAPVLPVAPVVAPSSSVTPVVTPVAPAVVPVSQVAPTGPVKYPNSGVTGTTTHTKNPDGSTMSVTHFQGQLPPGTFFQPLSGFPMWSTPMPPPLFYPWAPYQYPFSRPIANQRVSRRLDN